METQGRLNDDDLLSVGRPASIPAAETIKPAEGATSLAYYDSDAAQSVSQGTPRSRSPWMVPGAGWGRTPPSRPSPPDVVTGTMTRHYTDSSDNPA